MAHFHHLRLQGRTHSQAHRRPVVYIAGIVQVPHPISPSTVEAFPLFLQVGPHNPQILVEREVVQFWEDALRQLNLRCFPSIVLTHSVLENRDDD